MVVIRHTLNWKKCNRNSEMILYLTNENLTIKCSVAKFDRKIISSSKRCQKINNLTLQLSRRKSGKILRKIFDFPCTKKEQQSDFCSCQKNSGSEKNIDH